MKTIPSWLEAQKTERKFWDGMVRGDDTILRVLADNAEKAPLVRRCIDGTLDSCLEVGVGPFGLGVIGFLREIHHRFAVDPLPPVSLDLSDGSDNALRDFVRRRRSEIHYAVGCGEEIPLAGDSMDLVICCNVIDHTSDPDAILREIHRVLKPNGRFFFDVHTFSMLGLAKWHSWTKHVHRDEVLVKAHPYRMFESHIAQKMRTSGFALQKIYGHTPVSNLIGHVRVSVFVGVKCVP